MFIDRAVPLTLEQAHNHLKQFDCVEQTPHNKRDDIKPPSSDASLERKQLQQALLQVANHSDYQMLGICADSFAQGRQALETYATALGYTQIPALEPIAGPVYIKFNPRSGGCYVDSYVGVHRGVLVSCQSAEDSGINEMYGHLPLDLFC